MATRFAVFAALCAGLHSAPMAQALEDQTVHQRFSCLQREEVLEPLPEKTLNNRNSGLLRFKLRFESAEKPPKVELLFRSADPDMERIARRYLSGYRVPCLHQGDHPIEVVQEFSFSRWGHEPAVPLTTRASKLRFAGPKTLDAYDSPEVGKALIEFSFVDGSEVPEVRFLFNGAGREAQRYIESYAKQIRLIDSGGQPRPITVQQEFAFVDARSRGTQYRLNKEDYGLLEFLRLVKNLNENLVDLDLDSMQCPFAVRLNLRQPYNANLVREIETLNANRAYLLSWLSRLQLRFKDEAQQKDLFGSDFRISIPCGRLDLTVLNKPAGAASAPP
ncbi:hypothetical protein [Inhella sp.]|uniref:hypothetical protein n=1 Tax=Inhella sp. TaxID=1921806 RepID=UPI0035B49620